MNCDINCWDRENRGANLNEWNVRIRHCTAGGWLSNKQMGKSHIYTYICPGPSYPTVPTRFGRHLHVGPIETASNFLLITSDDKSHRELSLIICNVVMEARVNARSFRIATAESQRSKIGKIRGSGVLANRGRNSPLRHQPHLPSLLYPFS